MKHAKLSIGRLGIFLAAAILSLGLAGCGKNEEANIPAPEKQKTPAPPEKKESPKVTEKTPPPKKEETKASAPAPPPVPKAPPAAGGGGAIGKRLIGYWAVDKEAMIKIAMEQMPKEAGDANPQMQEMMIQMVTSMAESMMMEFAGGGVARMHTPAGTEDAAYRILTSNDAAGSFTIEVDPPDEDPKVAEGQLTGDKLTMVADGEPIALTRITADEFKARKEKAGDALKGAVEAITNQLEGAIPPEVKEQLGDKIPVPTPAPAPAPE